MKNLNWQRLLDYMACGGNIIFEDPKNVGALAAGVSTIEVTVHSRDDSPPLITLEPVPVLTSCLGEEDPPDPFDLVFVNKHIIFDLFNSDVGLTSFLSENGDVVGLYGQFGGRIALTGLDNNFHGSLTAGSLDPEGDEKINHYNLLFDEINWLLDCPPPPLEPEP